MQLDSVVNLTTLGDVELLCVPGTGFLVALFDRLPSQLPAEFLPSIAFLRSGRRVPSNGEAGILGRTVPLFEGLLDVPIDGWVD